MRLCFLPKHLQFPLTLARTTTIHKVQGLTLVVDMKGGRFSPGQGLNFNALMWPMRLNTNILPPVPQVLCNSNRCTIAKVLSATIQCFCETLNAHINVTCKHKGEVTICVPSHMRYTEPMAVSCMLVLPNFTHIQVALVYRSLSVLEKEYFIVYRCRARARNSPVARARKTQGARKIPEVFKVGCMHRLGNVDVFLLRACCN